MAAESTNENFWFPVAKRSRTKNKKNSRKVLPKEIISEIFSLLPAKSICRFKCCSKFFSELTEDKNFLKQQSDNSLLKDDTCFFIQRRDFPRSDAPESGLKIHTLHKQNASSSCGVQTRFFELLGNAKIVASSNGLLFCRIQSKLFVCNPTTLSCSYIPSLIFSGERLKRQYGNLQYVFECDSEEFKLFAFDDRYDGSFECSIYDPKKGVWKGRKELFFIEDWNMEFKSPVFCRGIIHVLSPWESYYRFNNDSAPYIATYDVESGMSRTLSIPRECQECLIHPIIDLDDLPFDPYSDEPIYLDDLPLDFESIRSETHVIARIFKWGKRGSSNESICLVKMEEMCLFRIWVLSDYEANLWSNPKHVNLKEMGFGKEDLFVVDFMVMNGDCLVFATEESVYKYDLVGEREGRLEEVCGHELKCSLSFIPYSSTLRSCAKPLHT